MARRQQIIRAYILDDVTNNLVIENDDAGTLRGRVEIPSDRINEFIEQLQKHASSEGDCETIEMAWHRSVQ